MSYIVGFFIGCIALYDTCGDSFRKEISMKKDKNIEKMVIYGKIIVIRLYLLSKKFIDHFFISEKFWTDL